MAISFVNKSAFASGTAALTVGAVASVAADDLILLFAESANQAIATPTGFTEVTNSPVSTGGAAVAGGVRLAVFYRFATGADTTTSVADSGNHTTAIKMAFRGVDLTTPFDATPVTGIKTPASTSTSFPGITTATANAWVVHASGLDLDAASTATTGAATNANLSSITERHDQTISGGVGGGLVVVTGTKATAGATGNTTATVTSTIQVYLTMALRPAVINYPLTCNAGAFTLSGVDAILTKSATLNDYVLTAQTGNYTQAGVSAILAKGRVMTATAGSYAQSGVSSILKRSKLVTALAGTYSLTGQSAILTYTPGLNNYSITAQPGAFTLSGVSAILKRSKRIVSTEGGFTKSGVSAQISRGRVFTSQTGSYSLAGQSATITRTGLVATDYALTCQSGAFLLGGDFVDDGYAEPGYAGNAEIRISRPIAEVNLSPRRKWYVRKNKQILIFSSAEEADAFIEADEAAEKAIEQAQKTSRRARKRVRQKAYDSAGIAPESVQIDWLSALVSRFAIPVDLPELIAQQDFDEVMRVYALAQAMADEDDVEILLMMG